ncbi:hypothetical protein HMPREF0972_02462 [Actinomyces sp. oral taxon 848 str. F0332]|nr:hypothetical protein HMPREF0972_02462 [Actinomyces sp. oral taxon 848 str. F0332]
MPFRSWDPTRQGQWLPRRRRTPKGPSSPERSNPPKRLDPPERRNPPKLRNSLKLHKPLRRCAPPKGPRPLMGIGRNPSAGVSRSPFAGVSRSCPRRPLDFLCRLGDGFHLLSIELLLMNTHDPDK